MMTLPMHLMWNLFEMVMGTGDLYKIQYEKLSECAHCLLWALALQLLGYLAGQEALDQEKT